MNLSKFLLAHNSLNRLLQASNQILSQMKDRTTFYGLSIKENKEKYFLFLPRGCLFRKEERREKLSDDEINVDCLSRILFFIFRTMIPRNLLVAFFYDFYFYSVKNEGGENMAPIEKAQPNVVTRMQREWGQSAITIGINSCGAKVWRKLKEQAKNKREGKSSTFILHLSVVVDFSSSFLASFDSNKRFQR